MMATVRRIGGRGAVVAALAGLATLAAPGRADAQFGDFGFGFGFGGLNYRPMSVENIYNRSDMSGAHAYATQQQSLQAPFRPRDLSTIPRDNAMSRNQLEARVAQERRASESRAAAQPAAPAAPAAPVLPVASFFDRYETLVWPAEAPTSGDLKSKRDESDRASRDVLKQVNDRGFAPLGTVTDARDKLLDYGRPALQMVRDTSTARVADGFHLFLMSLYESLGQAATPPRPARP